MLRRRQAGSGEINLTSLLDVLFCILFIVMLAGSQNEQDIRSNAQQQLDEFANTAQQQIDHLQEENARYKDLIDSYDLYHTEAVIVTLRNVRDGEHHRLNISKGLENEPETSFLLGTDRPQYIKQTLRSSITKYTSSAENQPIYVVFHCDRKNIYTLEYNAISSVLNELQEEYKEVFVKTMEAE